MLSYDGNNYFIHWSRNYYEEYNAMILTFLKHERKIYEEINILWFIKITSIQYK